ncbi:DNA repair protein RecO [Sphingosinicellaceae bacterium]|nr:DNA repair protein RecO [Sphingosinicellaceae bacterium]
MQLTATALVLTALPHGEHGAVVRFLTPEDGVQAGYVRGGRSRRLRPVLQPGNLVAVELRARVEEQLAAATVELVTSRAGLVFDRTSAAATEWLTALTAATLGEGQAQARLYAALDALFAAMAAGTTSMQAAAGVARYELLLLGELGFGLDLETCAATGTRDDLAYVSPRSSQAVSAAAGAPYAAKLLPLPALLRDTRAPIDTGDIVAALTTTGWFVERELLTGSAAGLRPARARFVEIVRNAGETMAPARVAPGPPTS